MRLHTALHVMSCVVVAPVTGGNIAPGQGAPRFRHRHEPARCRADRARDERIDRARASPRRRFGSPTQELDARPELVKTMSVQPPRGAGRVRLLRDSRHRPAAVRWHARREHRRDRCDPRREDSQRRGAEQASRGSRSLSWHGLVGLKPAAQDARMPRAQDALERPTYSSLFNRIEVACDRGHRLRAITRIGLSHRRGATLSWSVARASGDLPWRARQQREWRLRSTADESPARSAAPACTSAASPGARRPPQAASSVHSSAMSDSRDSCARVAAPPTSACAPTANHTLLDTRAAVPGRHRKVRARSSSIGHRVERPCCTVVAQLWYRRSGTRRSACPPA